MDPMHRREFLQAAGLGFAALHLPLPAHHLRREFAREDGTPTLVLLYLRGGMDALHALPPYGERRYYELRPTLAVPPTDTEERRGVIRLDGRFGLHPALASLAPLWKTEQLAPVVNVGSPHPTRSHFDAQDFMDYAAPGLRTVHDGWLNRYLASPRAERAKDETAASAVQLRGLAMQGLLPRSLRGRYPALAVPEQNVLDDQDVLDLFAPLYGGGGEMEGRDEAGADTSAVFAAGQATLETLLLFRRLASEEETRAGVVYPKTALGGKLRTLARVIRAGAGLEVAALDITGWDTHTGQGADEGAMPRLLADVGDSLAAFYADLGPAAKRVLTMTVTEFGRTCRENGNYGTDHGHGGVMFLLGGEVAGGKVHGKWGGLDEADLYQGRDLKVTTDFRDVFAEVLRSHFRFDVPRDFFPEYRPGRVKGLFG